MYENMEMRAVLGQELCAIMRKNPDVCVIDADLAKANGTIALRDEFPDRAFDVGVAEQNMAGVAAGLSSYGFIPFIGSFAPFATRRICDQIAVCISYAKQNVKIIGSDPGVAAELNGGTHMSFEDIGVLRSIPGMVIFEPCDAMQLAKALPVISENYGPVYIRLFRKKAAPVFDDSYQFDLFGTDTLTQGKDVTIFATGILVEQALTAEKLLRKRGIGAMVVNIHTIKPLDASAVCNAAAKTGCVVTCENHNILGGLNSAVSEILAAHSPLPVEAVGVRDHFGEVAPQSYLMEQYGLIDTDIIKACERAIARKQGG